MFKNNLSKKLLLAVVISLMLGAIFTQAFADDRGGHRGGRREVTVYRGHRYDYHEGRFYRPSFFGFSFNWVIPPIGARVTYLPYGHRTIYIGGARYYEYDNVYYQPYSNRGYIVVPRPVVRYEYISPNVVYVPATVPAQSQVGERETVTINVPTHSGGSTAITLLRTSDGFVGPQGEFYTSLPTAEQLRVRYGK